MTKTRWLIIALSPLAFGIYCLPAAQGPANPAASRPDASAPRQPPKAIASGGDARRARSVPARAARVEAARGSRDKVALRCVEEWMEAAQGHHGDDRAAVLEQHLEALALRGAASVYELEAWLEKTSVQREPERQAVFHALGRVGAALLRTPSVESDRALSTIHRLARRELDLPEYVEPDPGLRVEQLSERELHALLDARQLVEVDGRIVQPTTMNKLAAMQMLGDLGDDESRRELAALADRDLPVGVKLAAEHLSLGSAE